MVSQLGVDRQACMLRLYKSRFIVRNTGGNSGVRRITSDDSKPTKMMENTERLGRLHYADANC